MPSFQPSLVRHINEDHPSSSNSFRCHTLDHGISVFSKARANIKEQERKRKNDRSDERPRAGEGERRAE